MSKAAADHHASDSVQSSLVEKIREAIVSQKFKPGDRLNETSLGREFNVNRVRVRAALMRLEEYGLIVNLPRRGMFVNSLNEVETQQVNSVRVVLEVEALKLCRAHRTPEMARRFNDLLIGMENWQGGSQWEAAELDLEFHRTIWRYSGNEYLQKTLDSLCTVLFARRFLAGVGDERLRWILGHHRLLLDVIEGSSKTEPEEAMLDHLKIGYAHPERFSSLALEKVELVT